jgi:hypothetical protein
MVLIDFVHVQPQADTEMIRIEVRIEVEANCFL